MTSTYVYCISQTSNYLLGHKHLRCWDIIMNGMDRYFFWPGGTMKKLLSH